MRRRGPSPHRRGSWRRGAVCGGERGKLMRLALCSRRHTATRTLYGRRVTGPAQIYTACLALSMVPEHCLVLSLPTRSSGVPEWPFHRHALVATRAITLMLHRLGNAIYTGWKEGGKIGDEGRTAQAKVKMRNVERSGENEEEKKWK